VDLVDSVPQRGKTFNIVVIKGHVFDGAECKNAGGFVGIKAGSNGVL
jgi:hypothetical protein